MTISEQRRLAVARALAVKPKLLLMDEVMAGLNPTEVKETVEVVLKIRDRGISCLIVERAGRHHAHRQSDRGAGLRQEDRRWKPDRGFNDPHVIAAYLGDE
jgi:branched-chain amino acid transport system ATP-binding protein